MADCGNRHGSEIAGVRRKDIEVLISAEKLRTDFCVGAIDATTSGQTRINPLRHRMYKSPPAPLFGLVYFIGTRRSGNPLWGPHCPAGMDLVMFSAESITDRQWQLTTKQYCYSIYSCPIKSCYVAIDRVFSGLYFTCCCVFRCF